MLPPTRFSSPLYGATDGTSYLRYSTALAQLRAAGHHEAVKVVVDLYEKCGNWCPTHGALPDPIVLTMGTENIAFGCPYCSGPDILAAWEAEKPPS